MSTKLQRVSAGRLLLLERATVAALTTDVHAAIDGAAGELARQDSGPRRTAAVLALLLLWSRRMAANVQTTLAARRMAAREASRVRIQAELRAARVAVPMGTFESVPNRDRVDEDHAQAHSSADSLAQQWRVMASATVILAARRERAPEDAVASTRAPMLSRIKRTGTTETAQAYNDEHRRAVEDAVEFDRQYRDGVFAEAMSQVGRQWSALVDACPKCWPHHNEIVPIGEFFEGGDEPGFVHSHCRCIDILTEMPTSLREAA